MTLIWTCLAAKITASPCGFDTALDALRKLKTDGVAQIVIRAMVKARANPMAARTGRRRSFWPCSMGIKFAARQIEGDYQMPGKSIEQQRHEELQKALAAIAIQLKRVADALEARNLKQ